MKNSRVSSFGNGLKDAINLDRKSTKSGKNFNSGVVYLRKLQNCNWQLQSL